MKALSELSVRGKMLLLLFVASALPVGAAVLTTFLQARVLLEEAAVDLVSARVDAVAADLDAFHAQYRAQAEALADVPEVADYLRTESRDALVAPTRRLLGAGAAKDPHLRAVAILDREGRALLSSDPRLEGSALRAGAWLEAALAGPVISDPHVSRAYEAEPLVAYGVPVVVDGETVGVVALLVSCSGFWDRVRAVNGRAGDGSYAMVLDSSGLRIAHSIRPDFVFHPAGPIGGSEAEAMLAEERLGPGTAALLGEVIDAPKPFAYARASAVPAGELYREHAQANGEQNLGVPRRLRSVDWTVIVSVPERNVNGSVQAMVSRSALVGAVLVALALVVGMAASSFVHRPLRSLMAAAEALRKGDHSARVSVETGDELGQLGERFNEMASAIEVGHRDLDANVRRRTAELERANAELHAQREELVAQHAELEAQQRELEEKNREIALADRMKTEFLANMSHELRTPLNSIIGFSGLVIEEAGEALGARHRGWLEDVLAAGRHLLALINDLLDLTRIEAGRLTLQIEPVQVAGAVEHAARLMSPVAREKGIRIHMVVESAGDAAADPGKLRQILLNLMSNAVKFAPGASVVEVGAKAAGPWITFWVTDEGPGISAALRPRLFEPFVQGEETLTKQHQGTGLGLAITRRLVEHHGGKIEFDASRGRGCTFRFTLPAAAPGEAASVSPEAPAVARGPRNGRVLVIDDDARVGELLEHLLGDAGFAVTVAYDAPAGLDLAKRDPPDVFIVDLDLPWVTRASPEGGLRDPVTGYAVAGTALIDEIQAAPELAGRPILVLTALELEGSHLAWLRARVQGIAYKGDLTSAALVAAVDRAMRPEEHRAALGGHVLVVDDHDMNRQLARALLEGMGVRVRLASDGPGAIASVRAERPALVLLDLAMAGMDGYEVARILKADPETRAVPIVALTALAMRADEDKAYAAGVDGYLTKPIDRAALSAELARWLGRTWNATRAS